MGKITIFNHLPPNGTIIIKEKFLQALNNKIPTNWKIILNNTQSYNNL